MPYLGNELATQFQAFVTQTITGDGSTGYTLDRAVANGKELLVYINNVKQEEGSGKSYTASGTTITFSEAVASGDSCYVVFLGSAVQTVVPPDASVVSGMIANANLVMPNTLDMNGNELILDADADTSITADTDDQIDIKIAGSDSLRIKANEIENVSGDLTIDVAGDIKLDADGSEIFFADGGTDFLKIQKDGNDAQIRSLVSDGDIVFVGNDGGSDIITMQIDNSAGGVVMVGTTSTVGGTESGDTSGIALDGSSGTILSTRQNAPTVILNRRGSDGDIIQFRKDGSTVGRINIEGGDIVVGSDDTALQFAESIEAIRPFTVDTNSGRDDAIDLGTASQRFDDIHATNGSIQTSDQNEKQDIASITSKELNVAKKLSALFKTFRWKSKVAKKGDKARTHTGIIAQEIQSAFSAEGLDVTKYGLFTSTTWWEREIKVDAVKADKEKGIEAKDAYTKLETFHFESDAPSDAIKKTRLGVRYPELFSFIFSSIDARLTALESK